MHKAKVFTIEDPKLLWIKETDLWSLDWSVVMIQILLLTTVTSQPKIYYLGLNKLIFIIKLIEILIMTDYIDRYENKNCIKHQFYEE